MRLLFVLLAVSSLGCAGAIGSIFTPKVPLERRYDPESAATWKGEVLKVQRKSKGGEEQLFLKVRSQGQDLSVFVSPSWFADNQAIEIRPHDEVVVTGSKCVFDNKPYFVAGSVQRGELLFILRDKSGRPVWRAWQTADDS